MKQMLAALVIALTFLCTSPAHASGDSSCYPDWKVKQTDYNGCSSTALLSPGNDTRVNLLMLLYDRHGSVGPASRYSYEIVERRGEAEPFDWASFALKLGPSPAGGKDDDTATDFPFGTRCMSNLAAGADFIAAVVSAKGLTQAEKATLTAVRTALKPECSGETKAASVAEEALARVQSPAGRAFASYLVGAAAFYDGDFAAAHAQFARVDPKASAWLAEASTYMLARTTLNDATLSAFDEYGGISEKGADDSRIRAAETEFKSYLKAYPGGQYAVSARGLLRRVYWLGNRKDDLTAEYATQFAQGDPAKRNVSLPDLVQEFDIKALMQLKTEDVKDPMLLAVILLRDMRRPDDPKYADYGTPPVTRAALDALKPAFAAKGELFSYLQAAHAFYVADNPAEVLTLIPAAKPTGGYLDFSRLMLRALALDAVGDPAARAALVSAVSVAALPQQRGAAELALALHDERARSAEGVFAANSIIRDPDIREILLRYQAGPSLLRDLAVSGASPREKQAAIYTLLYKNLTRGFYSDFLRDLALVPAQAKRRAADDYESPLYTDIALFRWSGSADFVCPALKTIATNLAVRPKDPTALLCLGEFIRLNGLDPEYYGVTRSLDDQPEKDELGGSPSQFAGKRFSRLDAYKAVIADPAAGAGNRAYALYRAVYCYAPAGYNGCDATDVPTSQRKAWFDQLKKQYPASVWAKKLRYYW
ncbi:hypothetical protein [Sphingorhabdus contaminans]|uniref:hypothetical protein n=1 Tax=Sphingorhabdus contaminans TaxID=1343899 RepID=UPI003D26DF0C